MSLFLRFCLASLLLFPACYGVTCSKERQPKAAVSAKVSKAKTSSVIAMNGPVDAELMVDVISKIILANQAKAKEIYLIINSPGGRVDVGFQIAVAIENSSAPVTCIVDGRAASMAYYILQSCHKRIITMRSDLMIHEPSVGVEGTPSEIKIALERLKVLSAAMLYQYSFRLKVSIDTVRQKIDGTEWWMGWKEALEIGAVDEVIPYLPTYLKARGLSPAN